MKRARGRAPCWRPPPFIVQIARRAYQRVNVVMMAPEPGVPLAPVPVKRPLNVSSSPLVPRTVTSQFVAAAVQGEK